MFVAGFIGTPQMNFINAVVSKNKGRYFVKIADSKKPIEIPTERMDAFNDDYLDKPIVMGIRPKAISTRGDLAYVEQGFVSKINIYEKLGDNTILYTSMEGLDNELISSVEGIRSFEVGETVHISFDLKNVCFFDKETEESLL